MIAGIVLRAEAEDRKGALVAGSKHHVIPDGDIGWFVGQVVNLRRIANPPLPDCESP
jgi:hypothetical protein